MSRAREAGGDQSPAGVTLPPVNFLGGVKSPPKPAPSLPPAKGPQSSPEFARAQQHPRIVDEMGAQDYRGAKPTKRLFRGGERIA